MRILLLGKSGQVGWELQRALAPLGEVLATGRDTCDLAGATTAISDLIEAIRPDWIVNAAAYTAVDRAESQSDLAHTLNAELPAALADEAARRGIWLVHYSSDYVFDGSGKKPWDEHDRANPLSVYGQSKWEGDLAITTSGCRHLIFRTSWVFGARGGNFAKTIVRLARERDQLTVIDDQIGAPTGAELLADVTAQSIRTALNRPELQGTFHLAAAGAVSWYDYARYVLDIAHELGVPLKASSESIQRISTDRYPTAAQRPLNSRLDTSKFQESFGLRLPDWQQGVSRMLYELYGAKT